PEDVDLRPVDPRFARELLVGRTRGLAARERERHRAVPCDRFPEGSGDPRRGFQRDGLEILHCHELSGNYLGRHERSFREPRARGPGALAERRTFYTSRPPSTTLTCKRGHLR